MNKNMGGTPSVYFLILIGRFSEGQRSCYSHSREIYVVLPPRPHSSFKAVSVPTILADIPKKVPVDRRV